MKKLMYIAIAIVVILMIAVFAFSGNRENDSLNSEIEVNVDNNQNDKINGQSNEVVTNELINETTNGIETNEIENTASSETFEESPKTAEEKAIDIAKKDFGTSNNVEFSVEGIDGNGNYIVTVRNSQTTEALVFYTVNVTSQTFTKREMN